MAMEENMGGGVPATMLVGPTGYGGNNGGMFGDNGWWIILLFILLGGWGNNNGGAWGGNGGMRNGFDQAQLTNGLDNIQNNMYAGQLADMERSFAAQTASMQGMNAIQSQLAQCCCDNRSAIADLKYTVATENCADRAAVNDVGRDIIASQNAGVQRILDQLCSDKIDAKNEKIADLERQLTLANLAASQSNQTAKILADNAAQTYALEQYLAPTPRPAYVVQNPNCCTQNFGCNCGA